MATRNFRGLAVLNAMARELVRRNFLPLEALAPPIRLDGCTTAETPAGMPTAVSLPFPAPVELDSPGTYRLEIDGGELGGDDETGNHTGIDNLAILGTTGTSAGSSEETT